MEPTQTKRPSTIALIALVVVLTLIAGLLLSLSRIAQQQRMYSIFTFEDCKAAGYPIMESYPEQCATPDGRTFVNETQQPVQDPNPIQISSSVGPGCALAGCSNIVCVEEKDAADIVTTCEYRSEYACYQTARCEKQANGKCGWTQTAELKQCLTNPPVLDGSPQAI
jgi:hypothetical protein